jgi:DNA-binding NtrC family response regulator
MVLEGAGFDVQVTDTFSEARRRLDASPPDVLLTQLRLGSNNGLHLVLLGRLRYPGMGAIVTCRTGDTVLQAETDRMGVTFLQWPIAERDFVASVRARCDDPVSATVLPFPNDSLAG